MGVLATFDQAAVWAQTHVCDSLLQENLHELGAAWGRWAPEVLPEEASPAALLASRQADLRKLYERFDTRSLERIRLSLDTAAWENRRRDWRRLRARGEVVVYGVLEGTLLIHLRTDSGYVGVLCEAGEWLAIPAGLAYALDAGESPNLEALVLSGPPAELVPGEAGDDVPGLPSLDAFVETMLELTGHAAEDY